MRKYAVASLLTRKCVKEFPIPGSDKIIEKGTDIFIPIFSLHRDEKYYEQPMKFDPERFNKENSFDNKQVNQPYLSFGDGPRNCIGMKLGKLEVKLGLIMMLQKNKFKLDEKHKLKIDPKAILVTPLDGIKLYVAKR